MRNQTFGPFRPQTFGFRAPLLYHRATETKVSVTKFIYDTRPAQC